MNGQLVGEYFYDGEGKRVKKKTYNAGVVSEETIFVYSSGKLIAEYSTAAPPPNPTTSWTVTDQLGSPRVIVNSLGAIVSRRDFMPFGEEISPDGAIRTTNLKYGTGDGVRQKFTGYQKDDETGLDFAEARMYENRHARFTAVDPLLASGKSANPQTFNRYIYVMNSPLKFTDPTGLQAGDYAGPVYASADESKFYKTPGQDRKAYENFRVDDALDGYRYYITPNGWTQLGKTEDLIENDISDLESVLVGFKRMANRGFDMPLTTDPVAAGMNRNIPTLYSLTGYRLFSDSETETKTWRDWGIATGTEIGTEALLTKGMGRLGTTSTVFRGTATTSMFNFDTGSLSSRLASSTLPADTGSYLLRFQSGNFYAGKGPISRMNKSANFFSRTYDDPVVSREFFPAQSNREAFMNEHRLMMENGGPLTVNPLSPTYNKIRSPGCRFFCQ